MLYTKFGPLYTPLGNYTVSVILLTDNALKFRGYVFYIHVFVGTLSNNINVNLIEVPVILEVGANFVIVLCLLVVNE